VRHHCHLSAAAEVVLAVSQAVAFAAVAVVVAAVPVDPDLVAQPAFAFETADCTELAMPLAALHTGADDVAAFEKNIVDLILVHFDVVPHNPWRAQHTHDTELGMDQCFELLMGSSTLVALLASREKQKHH